MGTIGSEDAGVRLRRLHMRSWRRGTREMDLILGGFAEAELAGLEAAALDDYERLLAEDDHDLYRWTAGGDSPPERFRVIVDRIRRRVGGA